jgi:hypothetical protein
MGMFYNKTTQECSNQKAMNLIAISGIIIFGISGFLIMLSIFIHYQERKKISAIMSPKITDIGKDAMDSENPILNERVAFQDNFENNQNEENEDIHHQNHHIDVMIQMSHDVVVQ